MSLQDISAVNREFEQAVRDEDMDKLASLYTADAIALPPDGPVVRGRDAIRQMWTAVVQQLGLTNVSLRTVDFEQSARAAWEVGEATLTLGGGTAVANYVIVWKRTRGQWRLHRDIWNAKGA
jgi:uncharacterized protein (TIGR02246 family)